MVSYFVTQDLNAMKTGDGLESFSSPEAAEERFRQIAATGVPVWILIEFLNPNHVETVYSANLPPKPSP